MSLWKKIGGIGACLAAAAFLTVPEAQSQGREGCEDYARQAVRQAERNERQNCGFEGPRWSGNREAHFAWCLISPRQASRENEARQEDLQKCERRADRQERRAERIGKRANCDTYAKIAEVQAEANRKYDCGFRGGEWSTDSRAHLRWCMTNRRDFMTDEIRYRAVELQKCFNKLGDFDDLKDEDRGFKRRRF